MLHPTALCQLELHSRDLPASLAYFAGVFGWKPAPIALHEYVVLQVPADSPYGISLVAHTAPAERAAAAVVPYFRWEESMDELLQQQAAHGGRLLWGPKMVPAYGTIYLLEDPGGIQIGLFQALKS